MNKKTLVLLPLVCLVSSCTKTSFKKTMIKEADSPVTKSYKARETTGYSEIFNSANNFSSKFFEEYYKIENNGNHVVSPISVYFAIAMAAECADGNTRTEILNALGVSYSTLFNNLKYLYSFCNYDEESGKSPNKQRNYELLTNSIWLSKTFDYKQSCIDSLATNYNASSFHEDFVGDNRGANKRMSDFVQNKTFDMIKPNFSFTRETMFVLLNTLFLKSVWNHDGDELYKTDDTFSFKNKDGSTTKERLLHKPYVEGRILKEEKYSSFFVSTSNKVSIKFIVPNANYTLDEVMNQNTFNKINNEKYEAYVEDLNSFYYTEVNFPEFNAESSINAKNILENMGIVDLFTDKCNMKNITDSSVYCSEVKHVAKVEVDKKGIRGAAFTTLSMCGSSGPNECEKIYETFNVDKAFGFIIYDTCDNPVFSGFVNKI